MKTSVLPSVVQMEPAVLQQLVAEVKETLATDLQLAAPRQRRSFGAVDIWNIRRRGKTAAGRIRTAN
jgi:hypothetical protein